MKAVLIIVMLAFFVTGCVSYRGGSANEDFAWSDSNSGRGTTGVSSGADPAPAITGSDLAPR
jgi:hypothetical protein